MIYSIEYQVQNKSWDILPVKDIPEGADFNKVYQFFGDYLGPKFDFCKVYISDSYPEYALKRARFLVEKKLRELEIPNE